jgi:hypothetical protein
MKAYTPPPSRKRSASHWMMLLGFVGAFGSLGGCFQSDAPAGLFVVTGIAGAVSFVMGLVLYISVRVSEKG